MRFSLLRQKHCIRFYTNCRGIRPNTQHGTSLKGSFPYRLATPLAPAWHVAAGSEVIPSTAPPDQQDILTTPYKAASHTTSTIYTPRYTSYDASSKIRVTHVLKILMTRLHHLVTLHYRTHELFLRYRVTRRAGVVLVAILDEALHS